jgi:hypothetical protein
MFAVPVKLGRARKELSFTAGLDEPTMIRALWASDQVILKNAMGEKFRRVFRRMSPTFTIQLLKSTEALASKIMSLRSIDDAALSFYFANALPIYAERYVTTGLDTLTLDSSPMTRLGAAYVAAGGAHTDIINITGAFVDYAADGAPGGTNYWTTGAGTANYNATTRVVTLKGSPGAAGTVVYVNWTFNGALVHLANPNLAHEGGWVGAAPLWDFPLELEGA